MEMNSFIIEETAFSIYSKLSFLHNAKSQMFNSNIHQNIFTKRERYWVGSDEEKVFIIPQETDSIQKDFDKFFCSYLARSDGFKIIVCLGIYKSLNLKIEGNSILLGFGNTKKCSLTGSLKLSNSAVSLGRGISSNRTSIVLGGDTLNSIGYDCMFAHGVRIRNISGHAFIPIESFNNKTVDLNLINTFKGSLILEPHIWIGEGSSIFSPFDMRIGFGSIIKYGEVFSRSCPQLSVCSEKKVFKPSKNLWTRSTKEYDIENALHSYRRKNNFAQEVPFKNVSLSHIDQISDKVLSEMKLFV